MEAFIAAFGMVAIAEMGDKTQLLSFVLATRFCGRQWPIICGIFVATVANHFCAAYVGEWVSANIGADMLRWGLGLAFLAFAVWALIPDKLESEGECKTRESAFLSTVVLFFLAEMGDKTQLATVALGARYADLLMVTMGTTLGMMAANVPAVLLGERLGQMFPLEKMRFVAAALFAVFGSLILFKVEMGLGLAGL